MYTDWMLWFSKQVSISTLKYNQIFSSYGIKPYAISELDAFSVRK